MTHPHRRLRGDTGDADPVLVLISLVVAVLIGAAITVSVVYAQRWQRAYTYSATEQTSEDAARLAWMADVGASTQVLPAAQSGTTAATSVRFDDTTRESGWPSAATCRTVTWWLQDTTMPASRPAGAHEDGVTTPLPVRVVHRDVAYYTTSNSDGTCSTATGLVQAVSHATPIDNADPSAHFEYVNGHLRDLVYPDSAHPGVEACSGIAKGQTAALTACTDKSTATLSGTTDGSRTLWEWADPNPVQVLLVMSTDQVTSGQVYATQIGWREQSGRRELVGDPSSPVTDTLSNPPAPATPASAPTLTKAEPVQDDPGQDSVSLTRTDVRDLDGFDYQCTQVLDGVTSLVGPTALSVSSVAPVVVPSVSGATYTCVQRGWVQAVTGPQTGLKFTGGISAWSPTSTTVVRRPSPSQPAGVLNGDATMTFTWPSVPGVTGYEFSWRANDGTWSSPTTLHTLTWTTPPQAADTKVDFRVRPVNAGGAAPWRSTSVTRTFAAPDVTLAAGQLGVSSYTATWSPVADFEVGDVYDVQTRAASSEGWSATTTTTGTSATVSGVKAGRTFFVRVRAHGQYSTSDWTERSSTRPVAAPVWTVNPPNISVSGTTVASSIAASCEADTSVQYRYRTTDASWSGWQDSGATSTSVAEGRTFTYVWQARCVPGEGSAVEGSESSERSAYVPYSAPATPSLSNPTDGAAGTNITFNWNDTGGYYEVANYSGGHRAFTTSSQLTIERESGQTCARVRAAKNATAAAEGAWSGWSSTQCGTTLSAPGTPDITAMQLQRLCGGGFSIVTLWDAASGATSYTTQVRYTDQLTGTTPWQRSETVTTLRNGYSVTSSSALPGSGQMRVRANNSVGSSGWAVATPQLATGPCLN